jgi:hypothetical protein
MQFSTEGPTVVLVISLVVSGNRGYYFLIVRKRNRNVIAQLNSLFSIYSNFQNDG